MEILTIPEIEIKIRDLGGSCDCRMVEDWLKDGSLKSNKDGEHYLIDPQDIDDFVYDCQWDGTPFERGINDTEKIERLLLEIRDLKKQISKLRDENVKLEFQLGKEPF